MSPCSDILSTSGKPWAVQAAGQPFVYFDYNPVGDNTRVYSSVANDWERDYTYDWLGRRLTYVEGELAESLTYDGSNLSTHTQSWSENGLPQTKTTQYHYNAHRLDSVGYDDALTTIYHYDQYGRVDSLYDESGVVCYTYGNMGEIIKETRIYALPFLSQPIALKTEFRYDSWGRVDSIFYPDGERLKYQYDLGGQLKSITNNSNYTYLDNVTYDRFGAKVSQEYGNGLVTSYTYDSYTRRLSQITVADNSNNPYGDIQYGYDPVGNVTQVTSSCPWLQNQNFSETFTYDASDQLISASETNSGSYQLTVSYGNWGKITCYSLAQADLQNNTTQSEIQSYTYPAANSLQNSQTLFAPAQRTITDANNNVTTEPLTFGINGSLRRREVSQPQPYTEYYLFNSAANLKAYSNNTLDFAYYGYNATNTRTYKLSMLNQNQWVNGQPEPLDLQFQQAMFYPNAYLNFNQSGEYTKHYYNGAERIASRLGDAQPESFVISSNDRLGYRIMQADQQARADLLELVEAGDVPIETPSVEITSLHPTNATSNIFYYHTNHLGSTAYVTDNNATITQGFLYAPFGEITTEYAPLWQNGTLPKYAFNAKELDEETGMYYYEARYYKPPVFTSRDPHFERYPTFSPYTYCANNPVNAIDPDGRDSYLLVWFSKDKETGHAGIAVDNYKKQQIMDNNGNPVLDSEGNPTYEMVKDGTMTYYDLWPYDPVGKTNLQSDVKSDYSNGVIINSLSDLITKDPTGSRNGNVRAEGRAADGIVQINTTYAQDTKIRDYASNTANSGKPYNASSFNCSTFAESALKTVFPTLDASQHITVPVPLNMIYSDMEVVAPNNLYNATMKLPNAINISGPKSIEAKPYLEYYGK